MRVVLHRSLAAGIRTCSIRSTRFGHALLLGHAAVDLEHLRDLVADGEDRVQADSESWKIMAISAPRIFCRSDSGMVSRSLPL